jgi:O-antigen biosynthesis protein WbqP
LKAYLNVKQLLDFLFAAVLTLLISPFFFFIAVVVKLDSKGPILFKQKRIGKDQSEFYIYKFRAMRTDTPKDLPTHLLNNPDSYITKLGRFLRKSSLDELPQLFNILRGEMSFIGPRPALWNQDNLIEAREKQQEKYGVSANSIKPGITGWAQVNGRDELPILIKADFDGYYASHVSFGLDLKIFWMTLHSVFTAKGVSEGGPSKKTKDGLQ